MAENAQNYKNIIFDLGGVVVKWSPREYLLDLLCDRDAETETYELVFGSEYWQDMNLGKITRSEAEKLILESAAKKGRNFEAQAALDGWHRNLHTNHRVQELMRRLKKNGYHIFYAANAAEDTMQYLTQRRVLIYCEGGLASYEIGIKKPDERFYTELLTRFDLKPSESIYIDNRHNCTRAAYGLGMTGVLYHNYASMIKGLHGLDVLNKEHPRRGKKED